MSRTFSTCPLTLTFLQAASTIPSFPTMKVDLMVPTVSFPYEILVPQAPTFSMSSCSGSLRSLTFSWFLSMKFLWDFTESLLTPMMGMLRSMNWGNAAVKSTASVVHPGVLSFG